MSDQGKMRQQFEHERRYHHLLLNEQDPEKRKELYNRAYGELYSKFFNKESGKTDFGSTTYFERMLTRWIRGKTVVDIGCGLGTATISFAREARKAIGLEVDATVVKRCNERISEKGISNAEAMEFDGTSVPLSDNSVDLIYSNNVLEHLHPEDAESQLRECLRVLKPGGRFACITPDRSTGPHDISRFFLEPGAPPEGLHLKEYHLKEAIALFRQCGYRRISHPTINPRILEDIGLLFLYTWLQQPAGLTVAMEHSPMRRSGFLTGVLCLSPICLTARK